MLYAVVSCGALGNLDDAMTLMSEVPKLVKMRNNQLEEFCTYRVTFVYLQMQSHQGSHASLKVLEKSLNFTTKI